MRASKRSVSFPAVRRRAALLVVAEEGLDEAGNHRAWLLPGRTKKPTRTLSVKRRDDYAVTDLTFLPGGDLVILERRYRPPISLFMRMRRVAQADINEGAVLDGEVLIEMSLPRSDRQYGRRSPCTGRRTARVY